MEVVEVPVKMAKEREVLEVAEARKRKNRDGDLVEMSPTAARVRTHSGASLEPPASKLSSKGNTVSCKPTVSPNFDDTLASCFGNNDSSGVAKGSSKFVDLNEHSVEIATSNTNSEFRESRKTTVSIKFKVELHKLESTPKPQHTKSCRRRLTEAKMPSEAELDEFFAAAEKDLHKHFAEKYNFDFAKEEPLEGRYEWVRQ